MIRDFLKLYTELENPARFLSSSSPYDHKKTFGCQPCIWKNIKVGLVFFCFFKFIKALQPDAALSDRYFTFINECSRPEAKIHLSMRKSLPDC